jgi:fluoride exporter
MSALGWAGFVAACAAGAIGRHLVDTQISKRFARLPAGTWVVNVSGTLLLGLLTGLGMSGRLGPAALAVAGTGFCGAYTTFSTFTFETVRLSEEGRRRVAVAYALGSLAAGLVAAAAGLWLGLAWSPG